jgi:hypothetical protein
MLKQKKSKKELIINISESLVFVSPQPIFWRQDVILLLPQSPGEKLKFKILTGY